MKWGTPQPVVYRDTELGMVRLRAFGTYSMRVDDAQLFVTQVVGTRGVYTTGQIDDFLRSIIVSEFNDLLGETQTSLLDIQGMTKEMADTARNALGDDFQKFGLRLTSFQISAITPPEEVQKRIDERSGMGAVGNMGAYMQYKTAQAIGDAAQNPGGAGDVAATGVGLGAGLGMGQAMAKAMTDATSGQGSAAGQTTAPQAATITCPNCHAVIPAGSKFCPNCGTKLDAGPVVCPNCGHSNAAGAKFCTNCGHALS
jgi:membrane protease subunit (stomatin/prohibitin family)